MNDALRTALRSFIESVVLLLVLLKVVHLEQEGVAALMLVVTNGLTLTMFFWKSGQEAGT